MTDKVVCIFCKKAWGVELYHDTCQGREVSDLLQVALDTLPDKDYVTKPTFEENVHAVFKELEELLLSKHHDYGPKNIANAPGGPHNGLRVRLYDKLARLSHWVEAGLSFKHETAEESYKDIANYGVIGLLVSRRMWPNE